MIPIKDKYKKKISFFKFKKKSGCVLLLQKYSAVLFFLGET